MSAAIGQCVSKQMTDTVYVHPLPDARFNDLAVGNICTGDSVLLSAIVHDDHNLYRWSPSHFFNNNNQPEIYGLVERAGYVKLDVTSEFGCRAEDSLMINAQLCCDVLLPNAFTPNGDGKNDIFRSITTGHHRLHQFRIANRWGQIVFETADERIGWDGIFNGVPQDMGVYFYYMSYDCGGKTIDAKGEVNLVR
jgi:gliding motility-associated-like protein